LKVSAGSDEEVTPSSSPIAFDLVRGDDSVIPFVMTTERLPGYEEFVGTWDEAEHRAALADGRHAYFVGLVSSEPVGFAIVRDWDSPERVVLLKRIAVSDPGHGMGRLLLARVVDAVFEQTHAWRFWLGVFPYNERARRSFEAVGFQPEGIARGNAFSGGVYRDELVMALLRPDWAAAKRLVSKA